MPYALSEADFRDLVLDDLEEIKRRVHGLGNFLALLFVLALVWIYRAELARFFGELPGVGDG